MTGNGEPGTRAVQFMVVAALTAIVLAGCGSGPASSQLPGGTPTTTIPAQSKGRPTPGQPAFSLGASCTEAVSDGKDLLAVACPGSISRLDPSTGKPRWTVSDPTWQQFKRLDLGGDVVVASIKVVEPAAGLTAKQEGYRVVAVADGKKLWETKLSPPSPEPTPQFGATADVVVVQVGPAVTAFDSRSGRQRFDRPGDKASCSAIYPPLLFKDSVAACGQRFTLSDGSLLTFRAPRTAIASDAGTGIGIAQLDNIEVVFTVIRSDGTPQATVTGDFLGFSGPSIVFKNYTGRSGKVSGVRPDGSVVWEQAVSFDTSDGFSDNLSFANGSVWIRNSSNELVAVDGATGKPASPIPTTAVGLGKTAEVLATTSTVVVVKTGVGDNSPYLRAIRR